MCAASQVCGLTGIPLNSLNMMSNKNEPLRTPLKRIAKVRAVGSLLEFHSLHVSPSVASLHICDLENLKRMKNRTVSTSSVRMSMSVFHSL